MYKAEDMVDIYQFINKAKYSHLSCLRLWCFGRNIFIETVYLTSYRRVKVAFREKSSDQINLTLKIQGSLVDLVKITYKI